MTTTFRTLVFTLLITTCFLLSCASAAEKEDTFDSLPNIASRMLKDWQVRSLNTVLERRLRFQRLLAGMNTTPRCDERNSRLKEADGALEEARNCKYNGLSFSDYEKYRDECFKRPGLQSNIKNLRTKCEKGSQSSRWACNQLEDAKKTLKSVQKSCEAIGRPVAGMKPDCPEVAQLKENLANVIQEECSGGTGDEETAEKLQSLISKADNRIEELLDGQPVPASNDPRFEINF